MYFDVDGMVGGYLFGEGVQEIGWRVEAEDRLREWRIEDRSGVV